MKILVMLFSLSPPLVVVTSKQPVKSMSVAGEIWALFGHFLSCCHLPIQLFPLWLYLPTYFWLCMEASHIIWAVTVVEEGWPISSWTRLERTEKEPWPRSPRAQLAARPGIFSCLTLSKSLPSSFTHSSWNDRVNRGVLWDLFQFRHSVPLLLKY